MLNFKELTTKKQFLLLFLSIVIHWGVYVFIFKEKILKDADLWQLYFLIFIPLDFPISLIGLFLLYLLPEINITALSYPYNSTNNFLIPTFFVLILGPAWHGFLIWTVRNKSPDQL